MTKEIRERLLEMAKNYEVEEFERFVSEVGWEDWMEEFISDTEYAEEYGVEEQDIDRINEELKDIFDEAQAELKEQRENFEEIKLVKEGIYWTLYIGELHCGWGRFEDMVESISELETYEDFKEYARECQECR